MAWQSILHIATNHCNAISSGEAFTDDDLLRLADWVDIASSELELERSLVSQQIEISAEERGWDMGALVITIGAFALFTVEYEKLSLLGWAGFGVAWGGEFLAVWVFYRHRMKMYRAKDDLKGIIAARNKLSELKQLLLPLYGGLSLDDLGHRVTAQIAHDAIYSNPEQSQRDKATVQRSSRRPP